MWIRTQTRPADASSELVRDAEAFHEAFAELLRLYQFRDRDKICCHDVSVTQCYALEALARAGALSLNALAAQLLLDKSTASRVVATLVRKRYVERRPHPEDGRALVLKATASGRRLYERIRRDLVEEEAHLLADVEPGVRRAATELMRRLSQLAGERLGRVACASDGCSAPEQPGTARETGAPNGGEGTCC